MEEVVFKAESRDVIGKQVKALRRQGRLPAVIYGRKVQPLAISLDFRDASRVLPGISSSHLVVVELDGKKHHVLVRERQRHWVTGDYMHIDFQEVSLTEKLRAVVSIDLQGDSPAVKMYNGVVVAGVEEIEVECLPRDLPERIVVDLTKLTQIGDLVRVRDLAVSAAVEVLTDPDETVVVVTSQASEAELPGGGLPGAVEPEVIERGKKEEDF